MTTMIEVKVAELNGAALDWAVAKVEQLDPTFTKLPLGAREFTIWVPDPQGDVDMGISGSRKPFSPRRNWFHGGVLIDKYRIELRASGKSNWWADKSMLREGSPDQNDWCGFGPSALIAVCRAVVYGSHGDIVSVPAELVEGES